jgi:hypothetical protein
MQQACFTDVLLVRLILAGSLAFKYRLRTLLDFWSIWKQRRKKAVLVR